MGTGMTIAFFSSLFFTR